MASLQKAEVNPYLEKGPKVLQQTELDQQSKTFILLDDRKALPRKTAACHKRNGNDGAVN